MMDSAGSGEGALPSRGAAPTHSKQEPAWLLGDVSLWGPVSRLSFENCTEHMPLPTVRLSSCWKDVKVAPLPVSISSFACFLMRGGGRGAVSLSLPPSMELPVPLTA